MKFVLVSYQSIYLVNTSSRCADRKNIKKLYRQVFNN